MKKVSVVLAGASGRMGQEIKLVLEERAAFASVLEVDRKGKCKQFKALKAQPGVVIDFSSPELFREGLAWAVENEVPFVSGTTGITDQDQVSLKKAAKQIPVLWSANMSMGINFLLSLLPQLKALEGYDIQVEELHHRHKKDSPSGTAKMLQNQLTTSLKRKLPEPVAIRGGGIFGIHKVWVMDEEEVLVFEHTALNRRIFARGAARCAEWIVGKKPGLYQVLDVLAAGTNRD